MKSTPLHRLARVALTVAALGPLSGAWGQPPPSEWKPNALEQSQLPRYCQGAFNPKLANQPGYSTAGCGERFNHFCPALVALSRAERVSMPRDQRLYFRKNAAGHLQYTRQNLIPNCPLSKQLEAAELRLRLLDITLK